MTNIWTESYVSKETISKIESFVERYPDSPYGPAHIVLDDYNVLDGHLKFVLTKLNEKMKEYEETKILIFELLQIPEDER